MRELLWITERELRERRLVFVGAFLIGLLTLAMPLLPMARSQKPIYVINTGAIIMAVAVSIGVAILAGASTLGRDLAERRLGFYFSKPLGSLSIWGGKMLGAFLLAVVSGLLVVIPATLLGGGLVDAMGAGGLRFATPWFLPVFMAVLLFLVVLAHACSVALRARSKWILLDVVVVPLLIFLFWLALHPLLLGGAITLVGSSLVALACTLLLATIAAGAVGIVNGRSDIRVVHRGLSQTLAGIIGVFVLCFAGYSIWVRTADPSDLRHLWNANPAPQGTWVAVRGRAAGRGDYVHVFLINTATNQSLRVSSMGGEGRGHVTFSADGTHAAWIKLTSINPLVGDLMMADLSSTPTVKETNLAIHPQSLDSMVLSRDGSRVATVQSGTLSVVDTKSEKSIATTLLPTPKQSGWYTRLDFVSNGLLRIYLAERVAVGRSKTVEIFEFDLPARRLSRTGAFEGTGWFFGPNGDRLITLLIDQADHAREYHVLDARTGAQLANLGRLSEGERGQAWLTSRGPVQLVAGNGRARAELRGDDGRLLRTIDLGPARSLVGGGEPAAGKLMVALSSSPDASDADDVLVDLDTGTIRKVASGLFPTHWIWSGPFPQPGSVATRLYRTRTNVVYFDALSGERRVIAGR